MAERQMTLEDLLRMKVKIERADGASVEISPEFRVAVQEIDSGSVRIIIHASGYDSTTLDFRVRDNELTQI